jgi:hypothetical protein
MVSPKYSTIDCCLFDIGITNQLFDFARATVHLTCREMGRMGRIRSRCKRRCVATRLSLILVFSSSYIGVYSFSGSHHSQHGSERRRRKEDLQLLTNSQLSFRPLVAN